MSRKSALIVGRNFLATKFLSNFVPKYMNFVSRYVNFFKNMKLRYVKNSLLFPKYIYANYMIKRGCKDQKCEPPPTESSSDNGGSKDDNYSRHCYSTKLEELINKQINIEISAGYAYLNMASYFNRSNIALPGFYGFFMKMYYEEQEHALGFVKYQNLRGGVVRLQNVCPISKFEWPEISECFYCALEMEKTVKEDILRIYAEAEQSHDTDAIDFLDTYIKDQERSICEMSRLVTRAKLIGNSSVGKYLFDREMHETHVRKGPPECHTEIGSKLYA